jgi:BON domain
MKKNIDHEGESPAQDADVEIHTFQETIPKETNYPNDDHSRFAGEDYQDTALFEIGHEDPILKEPAVPYSFTTDQQHAGKGPKGYSKADSLIYEDICEALMKDEFIDASGVEVDVKEGVASLVGDVDDEEMRDRMIGAVHHVHGIKKIVNQISLSEAHQGPEAVTQKDLGIGENYDLH